MLRFRETAFGKSGSCFMSPSGKILGTDKKDMGDYDSIEHKWFVRDNYKKFGFTEKDLETNSSGDLLETAICNGWISARWGAGRGGKTHGYAFIRVSTVSRVKKRLDGLIIDLTDAVGDDAEIYIEEYGTVPFKSPPKRVFSGTPREWLKESKEKHGRAPKLKEAFSEEDYSKYFPEDFDPRIQSGKAWEPERTNSEGWLTCPNPDDYSSALWRALKDRYLPEYYPQLSEKEREEIAHIASNAFWAGNGRGHENGRSSLLA